MTEGFHHRSLRKPDGRELTLYSRSALDADYDLSRTLQRARVGGAHLRWNPLFQEWVAYAGHRQNRTFLPPKESNPLAPMNSETSPPTELPGGSYDVAVFENLFPSFSTDFTEAPECFLPTAPARGKCEVVVFTQDFRTSLGALPLPHLELILKVWADRYRIHRRNPALEYILPFENRGVEVGVTLHHPHGQIYSYPFVPPVPRALERAQREHLRSEGEGLIRGLLRREREEKTRIIYDGELAAAVLPACARYPYETWIAPWEPRPSLEDLTDEELRDFARALKTVLLKYDGLWNKPMPYLLILYAARADREPHPEWHFHVQIRPALRAKERLKYLAGTELGAGVFVNDSLPEEKAAELQRVEVSLD